MAMMDVEAGDRRGSVSSVGSQKRRREDDDDQESIVYGSIRKELEDFVFNESNKINKHAIKFILGQFAKLEEENVKLRVSVARLEGRVMEKGSVKETAGIKKSFAEMVAAPKVGKRKIVPRPVEKSVLVYPTDEKAEDSEATKKVVKSLVAPKDEGWQIQAVRKVRKGGVYLETGSKKTVDKIKEVARTQPAIRCVDPSRRWPLVQVYDVDTVLTEAEIKKCLFKQNLEEAGFTEKEVIDGVS